MMNLSLVGVDVLVKHPFYSLAVIPFTLILARILFKNPSRSRIWFFTTRLLIVSFFALALTEPVIVNTKTDVGVLPPITILADSSESMRLYNHTWIGGYTENLLNESLNREGLHSRLSLIKFSHGNESRIGDAVYSTLSGFSGVGGKIVLISDGNTNAGRMLLDVVLAFSATNATVNAVLPDLVAPDWNIRNVHADPKVTEESDFTFSVDVAHTGRTVETAALRVFVDGVQQHAKPVHQADTVSNHKFRIKLKGVGVHELRIVLESQSPDLMDFNNEYFKSVEVVDKPKMLLVTKYPQSPMAKLLDNLYKLDVSSSVPGFFHDYSAVVLDDIHGRELEAKTPLFRNYLLDGGGLMVVGGQNSFDHGDYADTHFETILPVTSSPAPKDKRKELAIMFLIDVSESSVYGRGAVKLDVEKAILLRLLNDMHQNDTVGVIAYNTLWFPISEMSPLGPKRASLESTVKRLKAGGGSNLRPALKAAGQIVEYSDKERLIIIISDGVYSGAIRKFSLEDAMALRDKGIQIYTVGVGFDTDTDFMRKLAEAGGGAYFQPDNTERLTLDFEEDYSRDAGNNLKIRDFTHYITSNLDTTSLKVDDFNTVYRKSPSRLLITTLGGGPIVTTWRFGLGRVATWTTDHGREWAGNIYEDDNRMLSRTANWAIGGLEQGKPIVIDTADTAVNQEGDIFIKSPCRPEVDAAYDNGEYIMTRITQQTSKTYEGEFGATLPGLVYIKASCGGYVDTGALAVNYPDEFRTLTPNTAELGQASRESGGQLFHPENITQMVEKIIEESVETSTVKEINERPVWHYPLLAGFAVYVIDALLRRILVIIRMRRA